jgi:methyl-accepting chemotaxis protein
MFGDDSKDHGVLTRIQARIESVLPSRIRRSYAAKFITTLLLVVLLITAIGVYIHLDTQQYVTQDTREEITGIAREEASRLQDWVTGRRSNTKFLAASLPADASGSELQPNLERKLVQLPNDVRELHVVDTERGRVVSSTQTEYAGQDVGGVDAPWASNADAVERGAVTVSKPFSSGGEPLVAFRTRLSDSRYVVLTASLAEQSKRFNSPIAIADIKVVNGEGTIVFDNQNAGLLDGYSADGTQSAFISEGLNGTTGFTSILRAPVPDHAEPRRLDRRRAGRHRHRRGHHRADDRQPSRRPGRNRVGPGSGAT